MFRHLILILCLTPACGFDNSGTRALDGGAPGDGTGDEIDGAVDPDADPAQPDAALLADAALPAPDAFIYVPDAEVPDAYVPECVWDVDCPQDPNPCTTGRCVSGTCQVGYNENLVCFDAAANEPGRCHAGACCSGCWDGTSCEVGTALAACGSAGQVCVDCDDENWCTNDVCNASTTTCSNPKRPTDSPCPGGTCSVTAVCEPDDPGACGGAGQPCCDSGNACTEVGYTCSPTTDICEPCGGQDEHCCYPGEICDGTLACYASPPNGTFCRCGGPGEPCCLNGPLESCDPSLICGGPSTDRECN